MGPRKFFRLNRSFGIFLAFWGTLVNPTISQIPQGKALPPLDVWIKAHDNVAQHLIWNFPPEGAANPSSENSPPVRMSSISVSAINVQLISATCDGKNYCPAHQSFIPSLGIAQAHDLIWGQWPESYRQKVRDNFTFYSNWLKDAWPLYQQYEASNFAVKPAGFDEKFNYQKDLDSNPVTDPPVDLQPQDPKAGYIEIVDPNTAFDLYAKTIAFELAWEMSGFATWSAADFGSHSLTVLFDGRKMFQYVTPGPTPMGVSKAAGYLLTGGVIPAPPLVSFNFLAKNGMLRSTRKETLIQYLDWERYNLSHTFPGETHSDCNKTVSEIFWGSDGHEVPASIMMRGLEMACPLYQGQVQLNYPGIRHWVGGCGGAAAFNEQTLRVINLPASNEIHGHFQNSFIIEPQPLHIAPLNVSTDSTLFPNPRPSFPYEDGPKNSRVWTDHADNPYNLSDSPEIPIDRILVDDDTFGHWFHPVDPNWPQEKKDAANHENLKSVSRRPTDLRIEYLPFQMLADHCRYDQNVVSNADSFVYSNYFESSDPADTLYSADDLEKMHFWERMLAKVDSLGGCQAILDKYWGKD